MENPVTVVSAKPDSLATYLQKVWSNRSLIGVLAKREIELKYAHMWLGMGWVLAQPLLHLVIYSIFFGYILQIQTFDYPYFLFVFSGLVVWNLFSQVFSSSGMVLLSNRDLITKSSFPKIIFAFTKALVACIENTALILFFAAVLMVFKPPFLWQLVLFPLAILWSLILGLAAGILVSSLSYIKRDLAFVSPQFIGLLIWITPVFYPVSIVPNHLQKFLFINPVTANLDFLRWTVGLNPNLNHFSIIGLSITFALVTLAIFLFKKAEYDVAEKI